MKITTTIEKFRKEWSPTGLIIDVSPTTSVQTFVHKRFKGLYRQECIDSPLGKLIEMTQVEIKN